MAESATDVKDKTALYTIPFYDWQREGITTFEINRAYMLADLKRIAQRMQSQQQTTPAKLKNLLLSGQTIILDDIAQITPNFIALLAIYNAGGKLAIGPHYVHVDGVLVSGESLIRNLLIGQADAHHYGMKLSKVAYIPTNGYHAEHLPQILRNFGIMTAMLYKGEPAIPLPVRWQSPDGSDILVLSYQEHESIDTAIAQQKNAQPDGPFIWFTSALEPLSEDQIPSDMIHQQSTLEEYTTAVRESLPDILRPTIRGDIQLRAKGHHIGAFSARMPDKLRNYHLQTELTYHVEPFLAIASIYQPDIEINHALLHHSWRLVLQNQQTLDGVCADAVTEQNHVRTLHSHDINQQLIQYSLANFTQADTSLNLKATDRYLLIWNPHAQPVTQVVTLTLDKALALNPYRLIAPDGDEQPFGWDDDTNELSIRVTAPPIGYAVYTLKLSTTEPTPRYCLKRTIAGRNIGNVDGEMLNINEGKIIWRYAGKEITNLLRYLDGGDAGDTHQYKKPI